MSTQKQNQTTKKPAETPEKSTISAEKPVERGGRKGPEPTRYGDWELNGKCVDF